MLRIGLIGVGFMGWIHHLAYQRSRYAKISAIATRDPKKKAGDWTSIRGNFGPPGGHVDLSQVEVFNDWESLIKSPEIDAVDICLPPAMHREVAMEAMKAGKHVLCEKPIALTAADGASMLATSKQTNRKLCVAHVLPFMGPFKFIYNKALSGEYGAVRSLNLKRIISDPTWIPDFYNPKTVGGPMVDLHIHDAHFIQLLCGMPVDVTAGGWMRGEVVEYAQMLYRFSKPGLIASASSGICTSSARMFTHGIEVQFDNATLTYELSAHSDGASTFGTLLYDSDGETTQVDLPAQDEIDAFADEIELFAKTINHEQTEENSPLSAELALNAVRICEGVEQSVRENRTVSISL